MCYYILCFKISGYYLLIIVCVTYVTHQNPCLLYPSPQWRLINYISHPILPGSHQRTVFQSIAVFLHVLFIVSHAHRYLMNISREQLINIHIFCTRQGYEGENDATAILAWFIIKHLSFIISQAIIFTAQFDSYHLVCHLVIYY